MDEKIKLSDLERDYLNEIFNIGVGNAASSLSQMVKQEIKLSVPELHFLTYQQLVELLGKNSMLISVTQGISGPFNAQSLLIFPDEDSLEIVRKMLGDQLSDESIAELQNEAMTEIGNIVLNACIGSLAETLSYTFSVDLPKFDRNTPGDVLSNNKFENDSLILFIRIELTLSESKITGYLAFLLGVDSFNVLQSRLSETVKQFI